MTVKEALVVLFLFIVIMAVRVELGLRIGQLETQVKQLELRGKQ